MRTILMILAAGAGLLMAGCAPVERDAALGSEVASASEKQDQEGAAEKLRSWGGQHTVANRHSRR